MAPLPDAAAIAALTAREQERFRRDHPRSADIARRAAPHWLNGVPMHWMGDWGTPHTLFVQSARGARLIDADGRDYIDFCLGDTGAMFGHSPEPIACAIAAQAQRGLTCMLPAERVAEVGERLAALFDLPFWQMTQTATDANRAVLRWARALTQRPRVLLFHGCYHGTVDETLVRRVGYRTVARPGLIGAPFDNAAAAAAVEFNDLPAVAAALAAGDIAAVLYEPVMTNIGMVLPDAGFHAELSTLTREHGALLVIDETHTLSTGLGGYTRVHGLKPDFLVCGKAIAGGLPCAVFGFTAPVEARVRALLAARGGGHSGMGTTLAGNALAVECLHASLTEVMTAAAYQRMIDRAAQLERGLAALIAARRLPWNVARVGARTELGFRAPPPRNGSEAEAAMQPALEHALHLFLLNRGFLITPFHNMMLTCPDTSAADIDGLLAELARGLDELQ